MLSCAMYKCTTSTVYICIIVFQSANIDLQVSSSWSGFDETSYKKDKGSYFVPGRFWRIGRIHQFLQIILVCTIYPILQIVLMHNSCGTARKWIQFWPPTEATTFAFASVFILLLCETWSFKIEFDLWSRSSKSCIVPASFMKWAKLTKLYSINFLAHCPKIIWIST